MQTPKPLLSALLSFALLSLSVNTIAQKRPQRARPTPPSPPQQISFDNLLSVDSYKIYVEVRNVGHLIKSSSVNEILDPVLKLSAPPKEFKTAVKWLAANAEAVTTSRMMIATWPTAKNLPSALVAVEFATAEEASNFEPRLKEVLPKLLPPTQPSPSPAPDAQASPAASPQPVMVPAESVPNFFVSRSGSLVFVTSSPLTLKNLKPRGSKALAEDQNFRTAYDRFTAESIFGFINLKAIEREEEETRKRETELTAAVKPVPVPTIEPPPEDPDLAPPPVVSEATPSPTPPDPLDTAVSQLLNLFFGGFPGTKWPEAIGVAINLDASFLDIRALLVAAHGEKVTAIPFFPSLVSGPSIAPESPSILPADTELFVTMSLDLAQIYSSLTVAMPLAPPEQFVLEPTSQSEPQSPFAFLENKAGIKLQTDLLPLLGNEVVFSMPVNLDGDISKPSPSPTPSPDETTKNAPPNPPSGPSPTIALSLKDKEGMRRLLPKLIDALGFKGASALAQVERREDTEIVTYANALSYAFIGNFLVVSPDVKNIKHVVDSYLKHETLSSDINFKNFTRWQPRQLQGQVYVSPALMEGYRKWANEPSALISDQTREFLISLAFSSEPITYALANEGTGPLHQVRVPKNLLLMAIAGMAGETNAPPEVLNERKAIGTLIYISSLESTAHTEKGSYLTLDELIGQKKLSREQLEDLGYRIDLRLVGDGFEATAVPLEYGKTGKLSYFINESGVLRAGDHGGGPATIADKPIR